MEKSLKARAVELLSRREYSRRELQQRLKPHAENPEEIEAVLTELAERHWQSDERFAGQFAEIKGRRWGSRRLTQALREKGVDKDTIAGAIESHDDLAVACDVWQRKFGSLPQTQQEKAKQMRFLAARGFPMDVISKVLSGSALDDFAGDDGADD
ncbi:recombination regulator RecX [Craterilacuibacter sp. RT1T]|uniref:recombination regulator RecX n=1 Tax=Craterilacuibacter sp. RT1T TaxID=2942211 RepID=UPI0020C1285C|nr:recombination regulator RecX [Craterilacuibacter sp. RT1T]MCL6263054.1 recombination regulator RecX [Craterilacuibacter sp. RT1T]